MQSGTSLYLSGVYAPADLHYTWYKADCSMIVQHTQPLASLRPSHFIDTRESTVDKHQSEVISGALDHAK